MHTNFHSSPRSSTANPFSDRTPDRVSESGYIVDLIHQRIFPGTVWIENGKIVQIQPDDRPHASQYILPGFIDAHIHIESSLLVPSEFARIATRHGTVATVSDPHEIANVLGLAGIQFMLANAAQVPFTIAFGAPSCVPATAFETAGAEIAITELHQLHAETPIAYLSEVMNYPGVLANDPAVMAKLQLAREWGWPIDGHAPGLTGTAVKQYAQAGISTDHECFTLTEAEEKLAAGMQILIREGSAAKNFDALHPLIASHPDRVMFCSDDKHPDDLLQGHINQLVQRAIGLGYDVLSVLRIACLNPVLHYGLPVGLLRVGDPADFIVVEDLQTFRVRRTYCKGQRVAENGQSRLPHLPIVPINQFNAHPTTAEAFRLMIANSDLDRVTIRAIGVTDGQLITSEERLEMPVEAGEVQSDPDRDVLKLAVINRYHDRPPAIAWVRNFGFKRGAIASSVAHDSHNIVAVGTTDAELCRAVNAVIEVQGGIAVVEGDQVEVLPLPIAGLMSDQSGDHVAAHYAHLSARAKELGSPLTAPFMTLAFMALLVIPSLKLSDRGLFNGNQFEFVPWLVETSG